MGLPSLNRPLHFSYCNLTCLRRIFWYSSVSFLVCCLWFMVILMYHHILSHCASWERWLQHSPNNLESIETTCSKLYSDLLIGYHYCLHEQENPFFFFLLDEILYTIYVTTGKFNSWSKKSVVYRCCSDIARRYNTTIDMHKKDYPL